MQAQSCHKTRHPATPATPAMPGALMWLAAQRTPVAQVGHARQAQVGHAAPAVPVTRVGFEAPVAPETPEVQIGPGVSGNAKA